MGLIDYAPANPRGGKVVWYWHRPMCYCPVTTGAVILYDLDKHYLMRLNVRLLINASELDISTLFDTKFACLITIHLYLLDHLQSASIMHLSDIRIPRWEATNANRTLIVYLYQVPAVSTQPNSSGQSTESSHENKVIRNLKDTMNENNRLRSPVFGQHKRNQDEEHTNSSHKGKLNQKAHWWQQATSQH